jgi:DNA-binding NarL/FixJ family response regulator
VAEGTTGSEGLRICAETDCDVIILDIGLSDVNGVDMIRKLLVRSKGAHVLVLTSLPASQYAARCFRDGALGFLPMQSVPTELIEAIRRVAEGRTYVSEKLAEVLPVSMRGIAERLPHQMLSNREYEILCLLGRGLTIHQIADLLSLEPSTIYTYRSRILTKTGLTSTPEIVRYVIEHKLDSHTS